MSKTFGYWRVSTPDQDPDYQIAALEKSGVDHVFGEHITGARMNRPELNRLLKICRRGDCIVVWKMDRLGRSLKDVLITIEDMNAKGIQVKSLTEPIDTTSPMGTLIMQILIAVAQMERSLISERTKAGMQRRKEQGQKFGKPHYIRDYPKRIKAFEKLWRDDKLGEMTGQQIVDDLNKADPKPQRSGLHRCIITGNARACRGSSRRSKNERSTI
jgi:DNA invertase Pin-like site-specific DNA recombinase